MKDRVPGAPGQFKAVIADSELQKMQAGEEFVFTVKRDDQPIEEGTPYSKATVLPDTIAAAICPGIEDPTPADAFAALHAKESVAADWANVDDLKSNGWYRFETTGGIVIGSVICDDAYMRVDAFSSTHATQTLYLVSGHLNSVLRRVYNGADGGSWSAWEWENPPMMEGVEYLTTERHKGNKVYVKKFNVGAIPAGTNTIVHDLGISGNEIVRFDAYAINATEYIYYRMPMISSNGNISATARVRARQADIICFSDLADYTGYFTIWYCKN